MKKMKKEKQTVPKSRINELIKLNNLKLVDLSKEFEVTQPYLSMVLSGKRELTLDLVIKFAMKFHLSIDYILYFSNSPSYINKPIND